VKDEFFALTLTGVGALFCAGTLAAATLGSLLHHEWETAFVLFVIVLILLSAARSDARTEIKSGIYRGRMFHVCEGSSGFSYGDPPEATVKVSDHQS
jgi:hypothetical protein